jgi:hypothetical protein
MHITILLCGLFILAFKQTCICPLCANVCNYEQYLFCEIYFLAKCNASIRMLLCWLKCTFDPTILKKNIRSFDPPILKMSFFSLSYLFFLNFGPPFHFLTFYFVKTSFLHVLISNNFVAFVYLINTCENGCKRFFKLCLDKE